MVNAFRSLIFVAALSVLSQAAYGQVNFSLGGEVANPISGFAELIEEEYGYGANISVTYWLNYRYQLIGSGGYVTYGSEAFSSGKELHNIPGHIEGKFSSIPLTIGLRYFLMKRLFIQGSAGVVYKKWRQEPNSESQDSFVKERDLMVSQGIGLLIGRFNLTGQINLAQNDWKWASLGVSMVFGKL